MAGLRKRIGADGTVLWYAVIYKEHGAYHEEPLWENKAKGIRPATEKRARELAERAEKSYHKKPLEKRKLTRQSQFTTVWPLFMRDWVEKNVSQNTINDYNAVYRAHFSKAPFARMRVSNITHEHILEYVKDKTDPNRKPKPLSTHTVNNHTAMLARFFRWAHQHGYWDGAINPSKAMGVRKTVESKPIVYLTKPEHILLLIDSFDPVEEEKYRVLTATLCLTGIRWSEARSLLWSQVSFDPKHPHLHIKTTAVGMDIQDNTKTKAGDRYVGLPPTLIKMLSDWRTQTVQGGMLNSERTRLGISQNDGLVFPSDAGTMLSPGNFRKAEIGNQKARQFVRAKESAHAADPTFPLDLTLHGLRHSYSMMLQRQQVNPVMLRHAMGHSTKALLGSSATYTHAEAERENPIIAGLVEKTIREARKNLKSKKSTTKGTPAPTAPLPAKQIKYPKGGRANTVKKGQSRSNPSAKKKP